MRSIPRLSRRAALALAGTATASLALPSVLHAQEAGVLRVASPSEWTSSEPTDTGHIMARLQIAETLVMVEPDGRLVGGLAEQRRIVHLAQDHGVRYVGHGWNTALGVAADRQMASAFPGVDLVEFIGGSPYVDGILQEPFALDADGLLDIPDKPGLGVTLDRDRLARYTPDPSVLFP